MRTLKWIAIVTMTIDHIGAFLLPEGTLRLVCRAIGRIAFPLFALMIAEGFHHTRNRTRYALMLVFGAVLSEAVIAVFWKLTGYNLFIQANVFLPLLLGLVALAMMARRKWYWTLAILPLAILAEVLHTSYGAYGILLIVLFGMVPSFPLRVVGAVALSAVFIDWPLPLALGLANGSPIHVFERWYQWLALVALVPIGWYNGERGRFNKWFFYIYYPVHLAVILTVQILFFA